MTGILGAFAEAWDEVRVHKSRVVLSLVGVFLAVFAMTAVTALGLMVAQVQQEQSERESGRPATLSINAYDPMTGMSPDPEVWEPAVADMVERYGITTAATIAGTEMLFRLPGGTRPVYGQRVSPSYGALHRIEPIEGRWFVDGDRANLSPALVVNEAFLGALGVPDLSTRPTVVIGGPTPVRATIVGVVRSGYADELIAYRVDRSAGPWTPPRTRGPPCSAVRRRWSCGFRRTGPTRRWRASATTSGWRCRVSRWTAAAWTRRGRRSSSPCSGWRSAAPGSWC